MLLMTFHPSANGGHEALAAGSRRVLSFSFLQTNWESAVATLGIYLLVLHLFGYPRQALGQNTERADKSFIFICKSIVNLITQFEVENSYV